ncbi:MAG TPA: hypothetical protein VIQ52_10455, partial [Arthrobacter sp.]
MNIMAGDMKNMIWEQIDKGHAAIRAIIDKAEAANRDMTPDEDKRCEEINASLQANYAALRKADGFDADSAAAGAAMRTLQNPAGPENRGGEFVYE